MIINIKMKQQKTSKRKVKTSKYEFGSYVTNPYTDLYENEIAIAKADAKAKSNPITSGMKIVGNLGMQVGSSMMAKGIANGEGADGKGLTGFLAQNGNSIVPGINTAYQVNSQFMANGGIADKANINVEGGEVVETPDGTVQELEGPSHAEGGINMTVPFDTAIYSKRLKGPDGKTMADRKIAREKELTKIEKLLGKSPGDKALKTTLDRVKSGNEKQEQADMAKMQMAKMFDDMNNHFASGGTVEDYWFPNLFNNYKFSKPALPGDIETPSVDPVGPQEYPNTSPTGIEIDTREINGYSNPELAPMSKTKDESPEKKDGIGGLFGSGLTFGDTVGLAGDLVSTFGPAKNTANNRAGDTPNVNAFQNYGKDALNAIDKSKGYVAGQKDAALNDIELARQAATRRGRNSARGVNTMRALDTSAEVVANNAKTGVYSKFAEVMQNIFGQEATLENDQDLKVMTGEQNADLANRQDRDNYYTQMAQDIATQGTGMQKIGKDLNAIKTRDTTGNLLNQQFTNFEMDPITGTVKGKPTAKAVENSNIYSQVPSAMKSKVKDKLVKGTWKMSKDGKLYNENNQELDLTTLEPIE